MSPRYVSEYDAYRGSKRLSHARPSLLSSSSTSNAFGGMYNLALLLLFVSNVRLILENVLNYGWLLSFDTLRLSAAYKWPSLLVMVTSLLHVVASLKVCLPHDSPSGASASLSAHPRAPPLLQLEQTCLRWSLAAAGTSLNGRRGRAELEIRSPPLLVAAQIVNVVCVLAIPSLVLWHWQPHPIPGAALMLVETCLALKLAS